MKKKIVLMVIIILLILSIVLTIFHPKEKVIKKDNNKNKNINISLMKFDEYKDIKLEDIDHIEIIRYTEGGDESKDISDREEIKDTYISLSKKKIIKKTDMACDDNTTIYKFYMGDNVISIEIECGILINNKERYILK